jgi:hypothetical protein
MQIMGFSKRAMYAIQGCLVNSHKFSLIMAVKEFYVRDDATWSKAGKQDAVTKIKNTIEVYVGQETGKFTP